MSEDMEFLLAMVLSGASIGLMYSLIALGFVLVYKATDAINFAQGEFVMLAGLILVAVLGFEGAPMIRGLGPVIFGKEVRAVSLPIGDDPIVLGPANLPPIQVLGAVVAIVFFIGFSWFFKKSRMGVAMRAVADSQQVAQAMGINVERYFALAWAMAGIVSALGGIVWGSMLGVDVQLSLVGLKVFPVVILGGLDSIGGALVGGLIIGIVESLAAGYLDPYVGGGTKDFAPYVLMILMLMIRPYGIFGRRQIERV